VVEQPSVVDTSFWTVGHRADVIPYLFDIFIVHVTPAVRAEVLAPDRHFPLRRYGHAELFRLLESRGLLPAATPSHVEARFGLGEAEAIAMARERGWRLLINDYRPLDHATKNGIRTMSVASFILLLYARGTISLSSADRKLELINNNTSPKIMEPAQAILTRLAVRKGERQQ
jgi:predicted nucleic acid-binding protein